MERAIWAVVAQLSAGCAASLGGGDGYPRPSLAGPSVRLANVSYDC
jgi:hypothetical protein